MKKLNTYISESILADDDALANRKNLQCPKTKQELQRIISDTIKEEGNECDLNFIDTSKITDMCSLFYNSEFNGDISEWDVSKVKDMYGMFYNSKFNGDISNWDVSNVENMKWMFASSEFNQNISNWKLLNIIDITGMFKGSKFNKDISKWTFNKSSNIRKKNMFKDCPLDKNKKFKPQFK